jgi:NAD-reducing hydrogenase large subunit
VHNSIYIDPVSRIEGHAKITLRLDDSGEVAGARFHVTEFRGFEEFCVGRPLAEMPSLTARTCGICPVSHLLASARAGDAILSVAVPPAAERLRRLVNLGQIVQSHALSVFHLSAPDLLLGFDADPGERNVFGLIRRSPDIARRGIRLRQFGQEVIAAVGGQKIHPAWAVPGGVSHPLTEEARTRLAAGLAEAQQATLETLDLFTGIVDRFSREAAAFGDFPSLFVSLVTPEGRWEHHDGRLRVIDAAGARLAELDPAEYRTVIGEAAERDSYLKSPFFKPAAEAAGDVAAGMYRVGPLARLNVCESIGTPLADAALEGFRRRWGRVASSSFAYHHARLVEILAGLEGIERLLAHPEITSPRVRAEAGINRSRGVGVSEAPRGTLFHDYEVDDDGLITRVNLIIATGQNNLAMNRTVLQIAREFVHGPDVPEGALNRVEAGIRAFDPCLSCSTHALGQMPLHLVVEGPDGTLVGERRRG